MLHPLPESKWNERMAAHLLARAGFGGSPSDMDRLHRMGMAGAVDHLVDYESQPDAIPAPDWTRPDPNRARRGAAMRASSPEAQRELRRQRQREEREHLIELRQWWLQRMAGSPRPLEEKLTLFWHGHFATSVRKVKSAYFMWRQNQTFRDLASGSWLALLQAVTLDPAMLLWLDQTRSRRRRPNENYAREVMELFTLGEGHYTESDITEAARAFTGLILNRETESGEFRPAQHDPGIKTILGRTGRLRWSDVLEAIVQQPQADLFITAKLWNYFAGQPPSPDLNGALAARFRESGREFKPLLRSLFRSAAFYHQSVLANQIKSPAQWLVASLRVLECPPPPPRAGAAMLAELGQELFAPPNVKGWDGGVAWITTNTLLARYNLAARLVYGRAPAVANRRAPMARRQPFPRNRAASPVNPARLLNPHDRENRDQLIASLQRRLLLTPLKPQQESALREYLDSQAELDDGDVLEIIRLIMSTPEYQVT